VRGSLDELVARHAAGVARPVAVAEVARPSLETVYLALTGRESVEAPAP
jgi:hypothetical protein